MRDPRRLPALVLALSLCACSATSPTVSPSGQPTSGQPTAGQLTSGQPTAGQPTSGQPTPIGPSPSVGPEPTPPSEAPEPLPEPELTTADEISGVLYDPSYAEVAVVSVLDQLGIGL